MEQIRKQKLTVSLHPQTVQKAKVLAIRRSISLSSLLAAQIEAFVNADEEDYEVAHRAALDLMKRGFHLGGLTQSRDKSCISGNLGRSKR